MAMPPLERLFLLELEYHRLLRSNAPGTPDAASPHTSYALQRGYDALIRSVGQATPEAVDQLRCRHLWEHNG